jgi:hypothetical protein
MTRRTAFAPPVGSSRSNRHMGPVNPITITTTSQHVAAGANSGW